MRPNWNDYFGGILLFLRKRSHDKMTQCSCIITDEHHKVLGMGYNGFGRDIDDSNLPAGSPIKEENNLKYPYMIHAEVNALASCHTKPNGGTAYISGPPCIQCCWNLHQNGIKRFVTYDISKITMVSNPEYKQLFNEFLELTKIEHIEHCLNAEWLTDALQQYVSTRN